MEIFNTLRQMLSALVEARGLDRAIIVTDMYKRLGELEKDFQNVQTAYADALKKIEELTPERSEDPDYETIDGKTYKFGEVIANGSH